MSRGSGKWGTSIAAMCLVIVCTTGCSQKKDTGHRGVFGTVTIDGKSLEKGTISFEPVELQVGSVSGGMIANGKYNVPDDRGLKAGKYRVRISAPDPNNKVELNVKPTQNNPTAHVIERPAELIPKKYNTESEEFVEVKNDGRNQFDFKLEKD